MSRLDVGCRRSIDGASLDHDLTQLPGVDGLVQPQGMRNAIECREMFFDQADRTIVRPLHDAIDFLVDDAGGSLAVFTRTGRQGSACEWVLAVAKGDGAQALAHTPAGDHLASNTGDALQVVFRSGCDVPDCHFLGGPAAGLLLGAVVHLVLGEEDLNVVAYHEGGHALTGLLQEYVDPVRKVTIVPRGQALGVTQYTPLDDRYNYSKEYLESQLVTALGGRAAEEVAIGRITTGAENDLQRVTAIARQMVTRWGMSDRLGTISFSEREDPFAGTALATGSREYSERTASIIDEEVNRIVKWAYDRAVSLLSKHHTTLDRIARALRAYETVDAKQLREIMIETGAINDAPASYIEAAMG